MPIGRFGSHCQPYPVPSLPRPLCGFKGPPPERTRTVLPDRMPSLEFPLVAGLLCQLSSGAGPYPGGTRGKAFGRGGLPECPSGALGP